MTDPFARLAAISALAAKAGVLKRTGERAKRAADLKEWGLRHPPPDPGSSLVLDDDGFMTQIGGLVHVTAAFPIMNATDSLAAAAELIEGRSQAGTRTRQRCWRCADLRLSPLPSRSGFCARPNAPTGERGASASHRRSCRLRRAFTLRNGSGLTGSPTASVNRSMRNS
jgi:hypothetical protein